MEFAAEPPPKYDAVLNFIWRRAARGGGRGRCYKFQQSRMGAAAPTRDPRSYKLKFNLASGTRCASRHKYVQVSLSDCRPGVIAFLTNGCRLTEVRLRTLLTAISTGSNI